MLKFSLPLATLLPSFLRFQIFQFKQKETDDTLRKRRLQQAEAEVGSEVSEAGPTASKRKSTSPQQQQQQQHAEVNSRSKSKRKNKSKGKALQKGNPGAQQDQLFRDAPARPVSRRLDMRPVEPFPEFEKP